MKQKIFLALLMLTVFLNSCVVKEVINYKAISVPEEQGMKFVKYTDEYDNVIGPATGIKPETGILQWYAAPLIAISPDGKKLAYMGLKNDFYNLYLRNTEGGKSVIQRTFNRTVMDMCYSPDGKKIAFTSEKNGNNNIYMINAEEGAAVQQIAASSSSELGPTFSSNGKDIYFAKEESGRYYVWSINLETALQTQHAEGFTPVLSPDGKFLIVTKNSKDGMDRGEIWKIDLETGLTSTIYSDPKIGFSSPAISPDGKSIVCVAVTENETNQRKNLDLYKFNMDGTHLQQLTFHPGHDVSPQWSPNGQSIYFISQRGTEKGEWNIWKVDIKQ